MQKDHIKQNSIILKDIIKPIKDKYIINFTKKFLEELSDENLSAVKSDIITKACKDAYKNHKRKV